MIIAANEVHLFCLRSDRYLRPTLVVFGRVTYFAAFVAFTTARTFAFTVDKLMKSVFTIIAAALLLSVPLKSHADFFEGFDDISTLGASGWNIVNNSSPGGTDTWFQETLANIEFPAQDGPLNSYIGVNYESTAPTGATNTISNWLIAPTQNFNNGDVFSFFTRKVSNSTFPDRLQVLLSTSGASSDVGTSPSSVGDFTTLLHDINPTLTTTGYPVDWTQFTTTLSGLSGPTSGRIAFRYFVTNGGLGGTNADYVGIDSVSYSAVPEPTSMFLLASVGAGAFFFRRRALRKSGRASTFDSV